jgi:16S rRNA (adenine1518-N6/adenine1519-N6)-dimethyltransferase
VEGQPCKARKRFGQHFLVDRAAIAQIAGLVRPQEGEVVLEIGPGQGALTQVLVRRLERLVAVEIDRDLAALLRGRLGGPGFRLIEGDILRVDLAQILRQEGGNGLLVVGNLPYNITAPLLFRLLEEASCIRRAVLMVQREVATRLAAPPGSRQYGSLSVLLGRLAQVEARLEVGRQAFRPVPEVDATVVELRFAPQGRFAVEDEELFARVVRTAFGQRRKMLRNSLLGLAPERGRSFLEELAAQASIELTRRPETLSGEEFARLSNAFGRLRLQEP